VCLRILRPHILKLFLRCRTEMNLQRRTDCFGDLVLNRKYVGDFAIECLRPHVIAGLCVDELRCDSHSVAALSDTSFEDRRHSQLACNLANVGVPALELK